MLIIESAFIEAGFSEVIVPSIWEIDPWLERSGPEIRNQLWNFTNKGGNEVTLIPEVTAIIQELYNQNWKQSLPKPVKVFYVSRCYRYERPQEGRYREFTQFGVEILGPKPEKYEKECKFLLNELLGYWTSGLDFEFDDQVVRGLSYYTRNGFEARAENLGAQKQIAGGGVYADGCGFAIGVDRVLLSIEKEIVDNSSEIV